MFEISVEIIGSLLVIGAIYQYVSTRIDKVRYRSVGEMIDIGGRFLHVVHKQLSETGPTVILEAGNGLTSTSWMLVQPEISKFANCFSYDRAGFGWSQRGSDPCTSSNDVKDLHALILKLNVPKPYILVGHSYGGMLNRLYTKNYPNEVAGIVLVDAYHEEQLKVVPLPPVRILITFKIMGFFGIFRLLIQKLFPLPPSLPSHMRKRIHAEISTDTWIQTTKDIFTNVEEILKPFINIPLINKPLTVISAGIHNGPELKFKEKISELQKDLVRKSTDGRQIIAEKSSHNVPFSQPEIIVNAVHDMVRIVSSDMRNTKHRFTF